MKSEQRAAYLLRDSIMNLLSDEEVARVSTAETAERLLVGDEYVDLELLSEGVHRAKLIPVPIGRILPRSAVHAGTWKKILGHLPVPSPEDSAPSEPLETPRNV